MNILNDFSGLFLLILTQYPRTMLDVLLIMYTLEFSVPRLDFDTLI